WGYDADGELGGVPAPEYPGGRRALVPQDVLGIRNAVGISAGAGHSLALLADGTVMSWGYGLHGALGYPTDTLENHTPRQVPGVCNAIAVVAGNETSYALLADGRIMAWGNNFDGELGTGASEGAHSDPELVQGIDNAVEIAGTFVFALARLADGTV